MISAVIPTAEAIAALSPQRVTKIHLGAELGKREGGPKSDCSKNKDQSVLTHLKVGDAQWEKVYQCNQLLMVGVPSKSARCRSPASFVFRRTRLQL